MTECMNKEDCQIWDNTNAHKIQALYTSYGLVQNLVSSNPQVNSKLLLLI